MKKEASRPFGREGRPGADENPVDRLRAMHERLAIRTSQSRRRAMPPAPPAAKPEPEAVAAADVPDPEPAEAPAPAAAKATKSRWK
jgi:hypothetical protein